MHFSDQYPGSHKKILMFKFAIPDIKHMGDMTRLVALVPYYIDLIGRYKLSSQVSHDLELHIILILNNLKSDHLCVDIYTPGSF